MKKKKRVNKPFNERPQQIGVIIDEPSWLALQGVHRQSPAMSRSDIVREAIKLYAKSRGIDV
jgi:hypothetical protein